MPAGALLLSHDLEQEIFGETYTPARDRELMVEDRTPHAGRRR